MYASDKHSYFNFISAFSHVFGYTVAIPILFPFSVEFNKLSDDHYNGWVYLLRSTCSQKIIPCSGCYFESIFQLIYCIHTVNVYTVVIYTLIHSWFWFIHNFDKFISW